jgi:hypothetical protein
MQSITLPHPLVNAMLHHAQLSPLSEVCVLIGARDGTPGHCYPVANVAGESSHLLQMDRRGQIDAIREMRGWRLAPRLEEMELLVG